MKQKIVMKMHLPCDKCRSKALKIAAVAQGVSSVSIEGEDRDKVVVIGDGMNTYRLLKALRKKFRSASIQTMGEIKQEDKKKEEEQQPKFPLFPFYYYHPPPPYMVCENQCDGCIIM